jgi:hypothetical protein
VLSRLRELVFNIRQKDLSAERFAESLRHVNRLVRLMAVIQQKSRLKVSN